MSEQLLERWRQHGKRLNKDEGPRVYNANRRLAQTQRLQRVESNKEVQLRGLGVGAKLANPARREGCLTMNGIEAWKVTAILDARSWPSIGCRR